jgi:hypothetical protein
MYKILLFCFLITTSADAQLGRIIDRGIDKIDNAATNAVAKKKQQKVEKAAAEKQQKAEKEAAEKQQKAEKEAAGKAEQKELFILSNLKTNFLGDDSIKILRVPKDKMKGKEVDYAPQVQDKLDKIHQDLVINPVLDVSEQIRLANSKINTLELVVKDYPFEYHKAEIGFYTEYSNIKQKQKQELDLQNQKAEREKRETERKAEKVKQQIELSENARKKKEADSLEILHNTKGYFFVNQPTIYLYPKPSKSNPIGEVRHSTYLVPINMKPVNGYVEVMIEESKGYVELAAITDTIFKISDKETFGYSQAIRFYYTSFTLYAKQNNTTIINGTSQSNKKQRVWIVGPRGGRYYINENGNKIYEKK